MRTYSDSSRADETYALPDVEVFYVGRGERDACPLCNGAERRPSKAEHNRDHTGYYWWACFPGCMPDSDAYGPFKSASDAEDDAQQAQA